MSSPSLGLIGVREDVNANAKPGYVSYVPMVAFAVLASIRLEMIEPM
jgi:hypothetical protein